MNKMQTGLAAILAASLCSLVVGAFPQASLISGRRLDASIAFVGITPRLQPTSTSSAASMRGLVPVAMDMVPMRGRGSTCPTRLPSLRRNRGGHLGGLVPLGLGNPLFVVQRSTRGGDFVSLSAARSGGKGGEKKPSDASEEVSEDPDDEEEELKYEDEDDTEFSDDDDDDIQEPSDDWTEDDEDDELLAELNDDDKSRGGGKGGGRERTGEDGVGIDAEYDEANRALSNSFDKEFSSLTKSEIMSEVQEMYDDMESKDEKLIRARIEMMRQEQGLDEDEAEIEAEIARMLEFEKLKREKAGKVQQGGIPGEISRGPPEISPIALYERAHDLHLELAHNPIFDIKRFNKTHQWLGKAEQNKQYLDEDQIKSLSKAGKITELQARVALALSNSAYTIMMSAPKAALVDMPGLTSEGGDLYEATLAIGDLFPGMMVRLFMRHVQYGILVNEVQWTCQEGLNIFGDLMCEVGAPTEGLSCLLRKAEDEFCTKHLMSQDERALVRPHFEMVLGCIAHAIKDAKARMKPVGSLRNQDNWEEIWESAPLKEYWDDPDLLELPEYYQQLKKEQAEEAAQRLANGEQSDDADEHPLEDPVQWRKWVEGTAWEDTNQKPIPIEEIFASMHLNLPGEMNARWLKKAGVLDEDGELVKKVERKYTQEAELTWYGPRYNKKKKSKDESKDPAEMSMDELDVIDPRKLVNDKQYDDDDDDDADDVLDPEGVQSKDKVARDDEDEDEEE